MVEAVVLMILVVACVELWRRADQIAPLTDESHSPDTTSADIRG